MNLPSSKALTTDVLFFNLQYTLRLGCAQFLFVFNYSFHNALPVCCFIVSSGLAKITPHLHLEEFTLTIFFQLK